MTVPDTAVGAPKSTSHLDERVLNAGTTQRFVLLLVLFTAVSAGTAYDVFSRFTSARSSIPTRASIVVPIVLVIVVRLVYAQLPAWKERRSRTVPLAAVEDGGRLRRELASLVARAGITTDLRIIVQPGATTASAVVFGSHRFPTVRLNGGLIVSRAANPRRFRAIVLHEFAHIHNRDVGLTYATVAAWRVLLAAVLVPDLVLLAGAWVFGGTPVGVAAIVYKALTVVMVYLTRADILRMREIYADRTAVRLWGVRPDDLLPGGRERVREPGRRARVASSWAGAWRSHPSWGLRERSMRSADELFIMRGMPMLVTGMAAAIASAALTSPFGLVGSWGGMAQHLLIAGLTIGIGGVALWRSVVHAVLTERRIPSGWRAGLWLGAGLAIGAVVSDDVAGDRFVLTHVAVLGALAGAVALLMAWTAQFAELRIKTYRGESLNRAMVVGLIGPWFALAFTLLWWDAGAWWDFSVDGQLANAGLPVSDAPWPLRTAAALTAIPGSDLGFTGLWWGVPLLWLLPLQLWLARLPRWTPNWISRVKPSLSRGRTRTEPDRPHPGDLPSRPGQAPETAASQFVVVCALGALMVFLCGLPVATLSGPAGIFVLVTLVWLGAVSAWRFSNRKKTERLAAFWLDQTLPDAAPPTVNAPKLRRAVAIGIVGGLVCWAGVLAEPLATGSVVDPDGWQVNSLVNMAWVVLTISAVMIVVAAVTAVAVASRYPLITALIAAGITGVIGVVGQYLKGTVDGCLGPFSSLASDCSWEPNRYVPLAEYTVGFVFGPGLLTAAIVAALAHVCVSPLRRRTSDGRRRTTEDRQLARPMIVVGFINAVAVSLVGSITGYQTIVLDAPIPQANLLYAYQVSPTGPIATGISPYADWVRYFADTIARIGSALGKLGKVAEEIDGDTVVDVRSFTSKFGSMCSTLTDIENNAEAEARLHNPAPPEEADRLWADFMDKVRRFAADCRDLENAKTEDDVVRGLGVFMADSTKMFQAAKTLTDWIARDVGTKQR